MVTWHSRLQVTLCLNISIWETDKNTTCNSKFYGRPKQYTTKWWSNSTLRWLKSWRRDSFPPMMEELLNLDNLSQEEKDKILGVLQKDEMVRQAEDKKIWWVWSKCYVIYMSLIQQFIQVCTHGTERFPLSISAVRFACPFKISWKLWYMYFEKIRNWNCH